MKKIISTLSLIAAATVASAQSYSIDWHTIDGGGGTSTGGVYSVSGTIGQPDAGKMSGGNYTIDGGFWGIIAAAQSPGMPLLSIVRSNAFVIVSWPYPSSGFVLQQNTNLNTTHWTAPSEIDSDNGTSRFIIVNPSLGNRVYRLVKP